MSLLATSGGDVLMSWKLLGPWGPWLVMFFWFHSAFVCHVGGSQAGSVGNHMVPASEMVGTPGVISC